MAARRAVTEGVMYDDDSDDMMAIDINQLDDEDIQNAMAMAYAMQPQEDGDEEYGDEDDDTGDGYN